MAEGIFLAGCLLLGIMISRTTQAIFPPLRVLILVLAVITVMEIAKIIENL